jgi:HAD superfamily hydrolase (TIGR01484 family)
MKPIACFPEDAARRIVCILTDLDDTLTTDGQLSAASYAALEKLHDVGLAVVLVTGRPAGWCDMIARFWPVAGVIGENGAFYFRHDPVARKMIRKFVATVAERAENRRKLLALGERILAEVPGAAISADQLYREADLAIDFCEDVPPLSPAAIDKIVSLFEDAGGVAKVSSIHVNGWFGSYDKLSMTRIFLRERLCLDLDDAKDRIVFCGDSPNDAPMFGFFPYACGVANVKDFEGHMPANPAFIASKRGGEGFIEIADRILSARASLPAPAQETK